MLIKLAKGIYLIPFQTTFKHILQNINDNVFILMYDVERRIKESYKDP
jgi:hypothetical protein